ncbi:MAG: PKD domain-containing protein [Fulvivirga sp.]
MKRIYLLIVLGFLGSPKIFGQKYQDANYIPPSPNASSLMEYASVPVNQYTGIPEINIPLYNLTSSLVNVPVSISYHASGIKVQQQASSVGLGWTLNAGGAITRLVRGINDEDPNGYLNIGFDVTTADVFDVDIDTEPDIFYFNFMGNTGRVVLDQDGNPLSINEQDFRIIAPDFTTINPYWSITDKEGVEYVFGLTANARERSGTKLESDPESKRKNYISAWYLSKIKSNKTKEEIVFAYQTGANIEYKSYRQLRYNEIFSERFDVDDCDNPLVGSDLVDYNTDIKILEPKYVTSITLGLGRVDFSYLNDRQDIANSLRLSQVNVYNYSNQEIKKLRLQNNDYFSSCSDSKCKRLRLNKIEDITGGQIVDLKSFQYNSLNLPASNSVQYDHWGFYNNNSYTDGVPPATDNYGNSYGGADKSPNLARTKAAILEKITNKLGGYTTFSYELNDYYNGSVNMALGGLRIAQIRESNGINTTLDIIRNYEYKLTLGNVATSNSSGLKYRNNRYDYETQWYQYCVDPNTGIQRKFGYTYITRFSSSLLNQFDIGGRHVGYSEVKVSHNNEGSELYKFTNFNDRADDPAVILSPSNSNDPVFSDPDGPPFIPNSDRSYERGLLKEYFAFDEDMNTLEDVKNEYDYYQVTNKRVAGVRIMLLWTIDNVYYNRMGIYYEDHRGVRLSRRIEKVYAQNISSRFITKTTDYTYSDEYTSLPTSITVSTNNDEELTQYFKYPFDYYETVPNLADTEADGIYALGQNHWLNYPIEVVNTFKKDNGTEIIIDGTITTFKRDIANDLTLPFKVYKLMNNELSLSAFTWSNLISGGTIFNKDNRYYNYTSFNNYDSNGKILSLTSINGISQSIEWGYSNNLVTAITKNAGSNQHRTTYQHKPLAGLTKIVDENEEETTFDYDEKNRLRLVKDDDGNIVSRYRYNLSQSNNSLVGNFSSSDLKLTNQAVNFAIEGIENNYGASKYIWDFGDGTVTPNSSSSISHSYSESGNYQVKLIVENPDYEDVLEVTDHITVFDDMAESRICSSVTTLDLCTGNTTSGTCNGSGKVIIPGPNHDFINFAAGLSLGASCEISSYSWKYRRNSGGWITFGGNSNTASLSRPNSTGTYEIYCKITDGCGNQYTSSHYIYVVQSTPGCPTSPQY